MNEVKFKANIKDLATLQATVSEIPEIPTPESTDEGKVLTVAVDSSGETPVVSYELEEVDALPAIGSGDAGKVLTVNAGETGAEWAAASGGGVQLVVVYTDGVTPTAWANDLPTPTAPLQWDTFTNLQPYKDSAKQQAYTLNEWVQLLTDVYAGTKIFGLKLIDSQSGITNLYLGYNVYEPVTQISNPVVDGDHVDAAIYNSYLDLWVGISSYVNEQN